MDVNSAPHQQFWSDQTLANDSQSGCTFSHSCQWFWSAQILEWLTCWMDNSHQWFWSAETMESDSHPGHILATLISSSHLIKHWRGTHLLDACSATLISGSNLLKHQRTTHLLDAPFSSVILICSNTGKQLTSWTCVQPLLLVVLI